MKKIFYIEVKGLANDENGNPAFAGLQIDFNAKSKAPTYADLITDINPRKLLEGLGDPSFIENLTDIHFITPEEYEAKYEENED